MKTYHVHQWSGQVLRLLVVIIDGGLDRHAISHYEIAVIISDATLRHATPQHYNARSSDGS